MNKSIECDHLIPVAGCPAIIPLLENGRLTLDGAMVPNFLCDHRIPVDARDAVGQSIACVGPDNSECPGCVKTFK